MNGSEFYQIMAEILKKEILEQSEKYNAALAKGDQMTAQAHLGASNEAEKMLRFVYSMWVN
jgi:hypothetical protein